MFLLMCTTALCLMLSIYWLNASGKYVRAVFSVYLFVKSKTHCAVLPQSIRRPQVTDIGTC